MGPAATTAETLVSNSLVMFVGQIAIKAIAFVFNVVVIRHLGSEQYGKFAICAAFGGLFAVLSDLGLAQLAVKRIARDRSPTLIAALVSNIVTLRVLLAFGVVALTAVAAWMVGYSGELRFGIFIATLGLISYAFFGMADTVALGLERFRVSASLNVGLQLATLAVAALFVFGGGGFLGLLAASTVAVLAVALIALRRFDRSMPLRAPLDARSWPLLVRDALPFAGITLALSVSYKADAVILSFAVPVGLIGAYTVAYNLVFTCSTLSHSINLALFPAMAREHAHDPASAAIFFRRGVRYLLLISLPLAVLVSLNAGAIVELLYGERFAEAAVPLAILSWAIPLMFLSEFLGYVAIVVDRETLAARANWVSSAGNVAANLAFIPVFGILAAAAVTVLTELLLVGQYLVALRRQRLFAGGWRAILATVVAACILGMAMYLARQAAWPVLLAGAGGGIIYIAAALGLRAVGRDELLVIRSLIGGRRGTR
jgi:O-antigen/teichoic acid export membrane protein